MDPSTKYAGWHSQLTFLGNAWLDIAINGRLSPSWVVGLSKKLVVVSKMSGTLIAESDHLAPLLFRGTNGLSALSMV